MNISGFSRLLLLAPLFALLACGGAEERKQAYLERGKALLEQKNFEKANIEFRNVLQIDPKSAQGWYFQGRAQEGLNKFREAMNSYTQALELDQTHDDASIASARIYLFVGETDKAATLSAQVLARHPDNADAGIIHASVLYRQGEKDRALADAQKILSAHPDHRPALGLLTSMYLGANQVEQAEAMLNSALQRKDDEELRVLLAQMYSDIKNYAAALPHVQQLIRLHPDNMDFRNRLAMFHEVMGNTDEAEKTLRVAVTDLPESMPAKLSLVQFLLQKRSMQIAQQQLADFIRNDMNNDDLRLVSASLFMQAGDQAAAEKIYRDIIERAGSEQAVARGRVALVQLLMQDTKKRPQAKSELTQLLQDNPQYADGLIIRASLAIEENRAADAIDDLRSVLKDQPALVPALKMLATAYMATGRPELAQPQLLAALEPSPMDVQLRLQLAQVLHGQKQYEAALEQLKFVKKIEPGSVAADEIMMRIYLAKQDYAAADALANDMRQQYPDLMTGAFFKGLVLQAQNRYRESIEHFENALGRNALAIEPLASLVRSALAINQPDIARKKLQSLLLQHPGHMPAQNLLGEVEMQQKQYARAEQLFAVVTQKSPAWSIGWHNLATSQMLGKKTEQAIQTYRKGLVASNDERLLVNLALALQQNTNVDAAIALYEDYLKKMPDSVTAVNNLALLLAEHRQDQASRDRALKLVQRFETSEQANSLDTLGWVHYLRGDYNAALAVLSRADKLDPDNVTVRYHMASAYFNKGDHALARQYLQSALKLEPGLEKNPEVQRMLAVIERKTFTG